MTAVDSARDGLCRMIASGELQPGEGLPSEVELCERLGVSRSSLREAQRMLGVAGVLTSRPGSRSFVSEMNAQQIMAGLEIVVPLLPLERYLELLPMRELLEGHVASMAAARMSAEETAQLRALAQELSGTSPFDQAQEIDQKFHTMIIAGAKDEMMGALLDAISRRGRDYRIYDLGDGRGEEVKRISDKEHRHIAEAIADRDPAAAKSLMVQHIRTTRRWLEGIWPEPTVR